jgi:putative addiction module component (TIGR02574 family)
MSHRAKKLLQQALSLPPGELTALVDTLHLELAELDDPAIDAAWDAELERRIDDLDAGNVRPIPRDSLNRRPERTVRRRATRKVPPRRGRRGD